MAVTPADLIAPAGPVELTVFPGENVPDPNVAGRTKLEVRLQAYIDQAVAKVAGIAGLAGDDEAVRLWSLHLAMAAAVVVWSSRPTAENTQVPVLGSTTHSKDQRDTFREKSREYREAFDDLVVARATPTALPYGPQTRATRINIEW